MLDVTAGEPHVAPPGFTSWDSGRLGAASSRHRRPIGTTDDDFDASIELPPTGIRVASDAKLFTESFADDS